MFAGTAYPNVVVKFEGKYYRHGSHPCDIETLHIYGKKDPFFSMCQAETLLYSRIKELLHEEGHKIPRELKPELQAAVLGFLKRQTIETPKLKVLCLHGFNSDVESFKFMT
jgi:hypothetical protein